MAYRQVHVNGVSREGPVELDQRIEPADLAIDVEIEIVGVGGGLSGAGRELIAGGGKDVPAAEFLAGREVGGEIGGIGAPLKDLRGAARGFPAQPGGEEKLPFHVSDHRVLNEAAEVEPAFTLSPAVPFWNRQAELGKQ